MKFCKNCGAQLPDNAVFCTMCGAKIEKAQDENPSVSEYSDSEGSGSLNRGGNFENETNAANAGTEKNHSEMPDYTINNPNNSFENAETTVLSESSGFEEAQTTVLNNDENNDPDSMATTVLSESSGFEEAQTTVLNNDESNDPDSMATTVLNSSGGYSDFTGGAAPAFQNDLNSGNIQNFNQPRQNGPVNSYFCGQPSGREGYNQANPVYQSGNFAPPQGQSYEQNERAQNQQFQNNDFQASQIPGSQNPDNRSYQNYPGYQNGAGRGSYRQTENFNRNNYQNYGFVNQSYAIAPKKSLFEAYKSFWKNYVNFQGRSRRSDYWLVYLMNVIIEFVFYIIIVIMQAATGEPVGSFEYVDSSNLLVFIPMLLMDLYALATLIPGISLCVRRLHDIGKGWAYIFMAFIPLAGLFIILAYMCRDSEPAANQYGPSPKYISNNPPAQNEQYPVFTK